MSPSAPPAARRPVDTIVLGRVLTQNAQRELIADGAVAVAGGDIVALHPMFYRPEAAGGTRNHRKPLQHNQVAQSGRRVAP